MSSSNSSNLTYADQLILCIFFFNNIKKLQDQNRLIWLIWITVWFHSIFCGCRVMEGCFRVYFSFVNQLFVGKEDDFESRKYRTVALLIAPLLQWRQMPPLPECCALCLNRWAMILGPNASESFPLCRLRLGCECGAAFWSRSSPRDSWSTMDRRP